MASGSGPSKKMRGEAAGDGRSVDEAAGEMAGSMAEHVRPERRLSASREDTSMRIQDMLAGISIFADSPQEILQRVGQLCMDDHADAKRHLDKIIVVLNEMIKLRTQCPSDPPGLPSSPFAGHPGAFIISQLFQSQTETVLHLAAERRPMDYSLINEVSRAKPQLLGRIGTWDAKAGAEGICDQIIRSKKRMIGAMDRLSRRMQRIMKRAPPHPLRVDLETVLSEMQEAKGGAEERYGAIVGLIRPPIVLQSQEQPE